MKRYTMSGAAASAHKPEHPERTASAVLGHGAMDFDVTFQVWPSRGAMLTTLRMQDRRPPTSHDWRACKVPA